MAEEYENPFGLLTILACARVTVPSKEKARKRPSRRLMQDKKPVPSEFGAVGGRLELAKVVLATHRGVDDASSLRLAALAVVDYWKGVLDVLGRRTGLPIEEAQDLGRKFEIASDWIPSLRTWGRAVEELERLRNRVSHTDFQAPKDHVVTSFLLSSRSFRISVERAGADWSGPGPKLAPLIEELEAVHVAIRLLRSQAVSWSPAGDEADRFAARARLLRSIVTTSYFSDPSTLALTLEFIRIEKRVIDAVAKRMEKDLHAEMLISEMERKEELLWKSQNPGD